MNGKRIPIPLLMRHLMHNTNTPLYEQRGEFFLRLTLQEKPGSLAQFLLVSVFIHHIGVIKLCTEIAQETCTVFLTQDSLFCLFVIRQTLCFCFFCKGIDPVNFSLFHSFTSM